MSGPQKYHFFVDTNKYETDKPNLTGAEVKAHVPGWNPAYQLFLEGTGDVPDRPVSDGETISLQPGEGHGVRKFYSVPPASFGMQ